MATQSDSTKRPICTTCSKPKRTCLCGRFPSRSIENSVALTILQHSTERKHPLNSARIAAIGLKNVDLVTVSDVNSESRFSVEFPETMAPPGRSSSISGDVRNPIPQNAAFSISTASYGAIISINDWILPPKYKQLPLDQLLGSMNSSNGFAVTKLQRISSSEGTATAGYEEIKQFEITVPPGSVLLFPTDRSVDIEAIDFQVKSMIVLDGTWAKAKRMYNENPWLNLLPHVKLNLEKASLYREVRHQPCPDYLSTIESIVYAMKALGGDQHSDLDGLLDVFESMVGDQRRCKDERLKKISGKPD
ncbi:hypothetical protein M569_06355 [Genlisea aurea]|uniref:tRNA-uridine aminocarboxypropyltransferase n=1 Tax=Genlisea aurea TaxID=192259 RepID=S8E7M9_9LAMI|nr:hypothetical protein M569_06355 [Genlisea aurea]